MFSRPLIAALLVSLAIPATLCAQEASSAEFGRGSGGELRLLPKASRDFSGSLGLTMGRSSGPFASFGTGKGYSGTLGGTLVRDRLWFFASGEQQDSALFRGATPTQFSQDWRSEALDAKTSAQLGDRQSLAAIFARGTNPSVMTGPGTARSSFLSLHYTGVVSSSMTFDASVTHHSATQPDLSLWPGFEPQP
jgi:hypothetical protein